MANIAAIVSFGICATAAACALIVATTEIVPQVMGPILIGCGLAMLLASAIPMIAKIGRENARRIARPTGLAGAILVEAERAYREHGYFRAGQFSATYIAMHFRVSLDIAKTALAALSAKGWLVEYPEDWGVSYALRPGVQRAIDRDCGLPAAWSQRGPEDKAASRQNRALPSIVTRTKATH